MPPGSNGRSKLFASTGVSRRRLGPIALAGKLRRPPMRERLEAGWLTGVNGGAGFRFVCSRVGGRCDPLIARSMPNRRTVLQRAERSTPQLLARHAVVRSQLSRRSGARPNLSISTALDAGRRCPRFVQPH